MSRKPNKSDKKIYNKIIIICTIRSTGPARRPSAEAAVTAFTCPSCVFTWQSSLDLLSQCRADDGARCARTTRNSWQSIAGRGRTTIPVCCPSCRWYCRSIVSDGRRSRKTVTIIIFY